MSTKPLIIELIGAPGSGKSTGAAYIYSKLKMKGVNCQLAREAATQFILDGKVDDLTSPMGQIDVNLAQFKMYESFKKQGVDYIVSDSSMRLASVYLNTNDHLLRNATLEAIKVMESYAGNFIRVHVDRTKPFSPVCRLQNTAEESDLLANRIRNCVEFDYYINGDEDGYNQLINCLIDRTHVITF